MTISEVVGIAGGALLVIGWLAVSFLAPGRARTRVAWVAVSALYLALASLFLGWAHEAWTEGNRLVLVAFGFLGGVFVAGFAIGLVRTLGSLRRRGSAEPGATH